jgi:hypothetical protein
VQSVRGIFLSAPGGHLFFHTFRMVMAARKGAEIPCNDRSGGFYAMFSRRLRLS